MKRIYKVLLVLFIFFSFNSIVYASDKCFYMPGKNNKVVVPKGYSAKCFYKYNKNGSPENSNYDQIALQFSTDGIFVSIADKNDNIKNTFLKLEKDFKPVILEKNTINWDGLKLGKDVSISATVYDENISGCPKSIYWINNKGGEKIVGFSSKEHPTISVNQGGTYAVYEIWMDEDDQIIFNTDHPYDGDKYKDLDIFDYPNSDDYNKKIEKCDSIVETNRSKGYGEVNEKTTADKHENIASCPYYFELDDTKGKCYTTKITFNYTKTTQNGKSTLSVDAGNAEVKLDNIKDKIGEVKLDDSSTYTNLEDYLIYDKKNKKWSCAKKIYVWRNPQGSNVVFGESKYDSFLTMYGADQISESHSTANGLCTSNSGSSSGNGSGTYNPIDFGDPVSVNCDGIIGKELLGFFNKIFRWIQILAPIFVIIMGGVEFSGAILLDDKDAMKKATNKFVKRLIIAVALFFIPLILSWLLTIFNDLTGAASSTCGIGG